MDTLQVISGFLSTVLDLGVNMMFSLVVVLFLFFLKFDFASFVTGLRNNIRYPIYGFVFLFLGLAAYTFTLGFQPGSTGFDILLFLCIIGNALGVVALLFLWLVKVLKRELKADSRNDFVP